METEKKEEPDKKPEEKAPAEETLESTTSVVDEKAGDSPTVQDVTDQEPEDDKKKKKPAIKAFAARINIYFLLFVLIVLLAAMISFISFQKSKNNDKKDNNNVSTQPLSQQDLDKLRQTDVKVGDPKQILSVESNAIFAGKVLIRDSLEVAGQIKVGGPLNLPGISVTGTSTFDQVQLNNLQISGNATIQGQLNIQNNVTIGGSLSVANTLTASRLNIQVLQINGDLQLNRHIDAGGGNPGKADGGALGAGGSSSVSGTDTAGTITINTGGNPAPGCFLTVNFTQKFNAAPHVVITPVGADGASINYYVTRTATNFSVCTANSAPAARSFSFDYVAVD